MSNQPKLDNKILSTHSNQDMSFNWLGSSEFGRIVPFHVEELIEGDVVKRCHPRIEMQMLPLASPTFGKLDLYVHYFYVPMRLVWEHSNDFFTETGAYRTELPPHWQVRDFVSAYNVVPGSAKRSYFKHWTSFGLPPFFTDADNQADVAANQIPLHLMKMRAYNQVWWDYYRDPELIPDSNRASYLRVDGNRQQTSISYNQYYPKYRSITHNWISKLFATKGLSPRSTYAGLMPSGYTQVVTDGEGLAADNYRKIEALTRMAERLSLSGKRQIDREFAKYGVKPNWMKLNMSQYIGGAKSTVLVSDITSTADTAIDLDDMSHGTQLGQKAGQGYCAFDNLNINYHAEERGFLVGLLSVMPHVHFVQGLPKDLQHIQLTDFYTKELEHVGQVGVPKNEIGITYEAAAGGVTYPKAYDLNTFAYADPYYEYKKHPDVLAGDFMYYHGGDPTTFDDPTAVRYMQSMGMYVDYHPDRNYTPEDMQIKPEQYNNIFAYMGGDMWSDADDHFHINAEVNCIIKRPMDGYAVPTLETTEAPHATTAPLGSDRVL